MFKQKTVPPAPPGGVEPADPVQQARRRARHRLIGAIVLLGIGIIGFPLVFETQPRPVPVDLPIEIPKKDGALPLVMPSARLPAGADTRGASASAAEPSKSPAVAGRPSPSSGSSEIVTESREDAGREVLSPAPKIAEKGASRAAPAGPDKAADRTAEKAPDKAAEKALDKTADVKGPAQSGARGPVATTADGARAQALLEGRGDGAAQRYVVQVGAFADATAAREARLRVEKIGLKTYTQVASTPSGDRVRVRVGPFASRIEAEAALAKAKAAGLTAVVLTL